jgi:hypothetical protein
LLDSLTDAQKFALTALLEVTPVTTVGEFVGESSEVEYVTTYRFATTMTGYPGWNWSITIADLPDEHPTIIESELMPAEGALLAPDWIPWSERLEEYKAAQAALGEAAVVPGEDDDDEDDDDDDDEDAFGSDNLHGGDLDGVDIDELDELGALDLQVDEGDQSESESDSGSENPPPVARSRKRRGKEQQDD